MNRQTTTGGISFASLLGLLFIALKLTGTITWSWWWVLSPFWIPIVFATAICFILILCALIYAIRK